MDRKIALVTGSNRGLGLETCRTLAKKGYEVIMTARDKQKGEAKANELMQEGLPVVFHPLDMDDASSIDALVSFIQKRYGRLDLLINNAGILLDFEPDIDSKSALERTLETNVVGPYLLIEKVAPLMKARGGNIVNVSSKAGQLASMDGGYPSYSISKAGINAVTKIFASELKPDQIRVNSVCPGWCKTDMGGPNAPLSVETGVASILYAAEFPKDGPTGMFFQHGRAIDW